MSLPCQGPAQPGLVEEIAHEFGDREGGVGVVELQGHLVREHLPDLSVALAEALHDVANRARDQEVLLGEAEPSSCLDVVGRVEDPVDGLDALSFLDGFDEASAGENLEVELRGCASVPQAERRNGVGAIACDEDVVGNAVDLAPTGPFRSVFAGLFGPGPLDAAAETDGHPPVVALDLPREAVLEPGVGLFHLPALFEALAEHPVVVAQTVAVGRVIEGGERIEEAGREAAEAAVAEPGVRLLLDDGVEIEAEHLHGLPRGVEEAGGDEVVEQEPAEEVLHRQVVDHLRLHSVIGSTGENLPVDDGFADRRGPSRRSGRPAGRGAVRGRRCT